MLLRMRLLIACVVVLASCAKGGVEIVVRSENSAVTKVVLFVGVGDEYSEALMPAQHAVPFAKSSAWARDAYNELDVRSVSDGAPAVFQFQGEGELGVVIAVGFAGDQPVAAAQHEGIPIPSDAVARYELALEPINNTTSPLVLDLWESQAGSPKAGATCVALFDKRTNSADAVVTHGDPDCDGWPTDDPKECQPNFYMSFGRPALDDVACLVNERVVTTDGTLSDGCVLGGPPCRDGVGPEGACTAPSAYCTPKSVCTRCQMTPNSWDCARDITPLAAQFPSHLHCRIGFDANGKLCEGMRKAMSQPPMNIGGHFCDTSSDRPVRITTKGQDWGPSLAFTNGTTQLQIEVKNLQPNCNFDVGIAGAAQAKGIYAGMVAGMLDNGRGIAVPIVFEIDPLLVGCDQAACQPTWSWDLTELVDQCVNTPVFPP
jgi:hypothetical protein